MSEPRKSLFFGTVQNLGNSLEIECSRLAKSNAILLVISDEEIKDIDKTGNDESDGEDVDDDEDKDDNDEINKEVTDFLNEDDDDKPVDIFQGVELQEGDVEDDTNVDAENEDTEEKADAAFKYQDSFGRRIVITAGMYATHLGCYRDHGNRAIPSLEGKDRLLNGPYRSRRYAIEKCALAAARRGWKYFAVQAGGWCASSPTAGRTYNKYGRYNTCRNGKGGPWGNDVYALQGIPRQRTTKGEICVFPFKYQGLDYNSCTTRDHHRPWCVVTPDYDVDTLWGQCPIEPGSILVITHGLTGVLSSRDLDVGEVASIRHAGPESELRKAILDEEIKEIEKAGNDESDGEDVDDDEDKDDNDEINKEVTDFLNEDDDDKPVDIFQGVELQEGDVEEDTNVDAENEETEEKADAALKYQDSFGRRIVITAGMYATHLGCYRDHWHRAIPTLEGKDRLLNGHYRSRRYAIRKCALAAARRGWKYFAVQHNGWCASSPTAGRTYNKYGRYNTCRNGKGGPWGNDVYVLKGTS
ncbi:hypothetical protein QZH41_014739 [Actinostola sp. cb2023]|nr:hypothetical protein QZH41_014739 [Actinostola sp. cb2023]